MAQGRGPRQGGNSARRVKARISLRMRAMAVVAGRESRDRVYYEANRAHPPYPELHRTVLKTVGLADVLRQALGVRRIEWAFVFGSFARGEETTESDLDLMVIGDLGLRGVTGLLAGVSEQIGREVNPHVLRREELLRRKASREAFVVRVLAGPKLFIVGDPNEFETVVG